MARTRKPPPAGQIEYLPRPFDPDTDVAALAQPRWNGLKTGDWGVRYYQTSGDARCLFVILRISDDVQVKGEKVPFHNQLADICRGIARRTQIRRQIAAVFWDCESAGDYRGSGARRRTIERNGFSRCLEEAASADRPCAELWSWRADRLARGYRYLPRLMELQEQRVALHDSTARIREDHLPREIEYAKRERETFRMRGQIGKRSTAENRRKPPTRRIPLGWLPRWPDVSAAGVIPDKRDYEVVHDPETMPAFEACLTGLRFGGWSWDDALERLTAEGVRRHADRNGAADAKGLPWTGALFRKGLGNHRWWLGEGKWTVPTTVRDEEGEEQAGPPEVIPFPVPPALVDDPEHGRRPLTADDLALIRAVPVQRGGGHRRGDVGQQRPLGGKVRCAVCERSLRHQRVRSRLGDYYLLRCDSPSLAKLTGRQRCDRRPVTLRETGVLDDVWQSVAAAFLDPQAVAAECRAELTRVERLPVLRDTAGLRARLDALRHDEAGLLLNRQREPEHADAYDVALATVRSQKAGVTESLVALEQEARTLVARRDELARTVEAMDAFAAGLAGSDPDARARYERLFREATAAERAELIGAVVETATVTRSGAWRVRVRFAGAGGVLARLVPLGSDCTINTDWYKRAPAVTLAGGRRAA